MLSFLLLLLLVSVPNISSFLSRPQKNVIARTGTDRIVGQLYEKSSSKPDYDVVIIGAGITGLATAVALSRLVPDVKICVCERSSSLRPVGALVGLFPNGLTALNGVCPDMAQDILEKASPYLGTIQSDIKGNVVREQLQEKSKNGALMYVWYLLQKHLANALYNNHDPNVINLGSVFEKYEINQQTTLVKVTVRDRIHSNENSHLESRSFTCRVLIGADGLRSKVRSQMVKAENNTEGIFTFFNRTMYRAALDINSIPQDLRPSKRGISYTYRCGEIGKVFAFHESADGILTFTASVISDKALDEKDCERSLKNSAYETQFENVKKRLKQHFSTYPPRVKSIIEHTNASSIHENMVYDIDVLNSWSDGPVILIGDAAHAMTPSLGQGGNVGLEDSCELAHTLAPVMMDKRYTDISSVLEDFWRERLPRVKEIHEKSRQQAIALNSKNDAAFTFRKRNKDFYDRLYDWKPTFRCT